MLGGANVPERKVRVASTVVATKVFVSLRPRWVTWSPGPTRCNLRRKWRTDPDEGVPRPWRDGRGVVAEAVRGRAGGAGRRGAAGQPAGRQRGASGPRLPPAVRIGPRRRGRRPFLRGSSGEPRRGRARARLRRPAPICVPAPQAGLSGAASDRALAARPLPGADRTGRVRPL